MSTKTKTKPGTKAAPTRPPATPPAGAESLMSLAQIGAALGVSGRKVEKMVAAGEYPPADTSIGNLRRWRVGTHNAWLAARCERKG